MRRLRVRETAGFSLIEVVIIVGIIGLMVAFAVPMFANFAKKAKMVEGETVATELKRLEERYYMDNLQYSNNLQQLTFQTSSLKYYTAVVIQVGGNDPSTGNPILYQAVISGNVDSDPDLDTWILTMNMNGLHTIQHGCMPGGVGPYQLNCTD